MKKILTVILAAAMLATLCACTKSPKNPSYDDIDDVVYDGGNIVFDNVELTVWSVCTEPDSVYQDQIISDFNEAYEGQIKVTAKHESRYSIYKSLADAVALNDNPPDMFYGYGERIAAMVNNKLFVPLQGYLEQAETGFEADYFEPTLINNCYVGNDLFGLPISVDSAQIYCRKDILAKNGFSIPKNMNELYAVCDAIVELAAAGNLWVRSNETISSSNPEGWVKYSPSSPYYPFPISSGDMWVKDYVGYTAMIQNGAELVSKDGKVAFDNQSAANGLQVLRDWIYPTETSKNKHAFSRAGLNYDAGQADFLNGNCVFKLEGAWSAYNHCNTFDQKFRAVGGSDSCLEIFNTAGMFALDQNADCAGKIFGDSHAISIVRTCKSRTKRIACAIFANYLAENSGGVWTQAGHLPASLVVQSSNEMYLGNEYYLKYVKNYGSPSDYVTFPSTKYYDEMTQSLTYAIQQSVADTYRNQTTLQILSANAEDCRIRIKNREEL